MDRLHQSDDGRTNIVNNRFTRTADSSGRAHPRRTRYRQSYLPRAGGPWHEHHLRPATGVGAGRHLLRTHLGMARAPRGQRWRVWSPLLVRRRADPEAVLALPPSATHGGLGLSVGPSVITALSRVIPIAWR